jgi:O-succinylbenzoate synthase
VSFDSGLATAALLAADVTRTPLLPENGQIPVRRVEVDETLLTQFAASPARAEWWLDRLRRTHALLEA